MYKRQEVFREVNDMDTAEGFSLEGEGIELENIAGDAAGSDAPEEDLFEDCLLYTSFRV